MKGIGPHELIGVSLNNGWSIDGYLPPRNTTGGNLSVAFSATNSNGQKGFVKVIDFRRAMASPDPSAALEPLIQQFEFERFLLHECRRIRGIVTAIESGKIDFDGYPIQYLIFEMADGDLRQVRSQSEILSPLETLGAAHSVINALRNLHTKKICHQDIKPSNILIYQRNDAKISDLGRACHALKDGPFDHLDFPGQLSYAPPEFQYRWFASDWDTRRRASDLYMLGSLMLFMFTGATMNSLMFAELSDEHVPAKWGGTFSEVIPFLLNAQDKVRDRLKNDLVDFYCLHAQELVVQAIEWLCHPDPAKRGHPASRRQGAPYDLQRFVSLLDLSIRHQRREAA